MRDMPDGTQQPSIIYNGFLGEDYQPLRPDEATLSWLLEGGVRRVVAGHLPHGDAPLLLRFGAVQCVTADISYAHHVEAAGGVSQAVCEVLLEEETTVHGRLATGEGYEARLSDAKMGEVRDGWRVKGRLLDGRLILSRNDGWDFANRFEEEEKGAHACVDGLQRSSCRKGMDEFMYLKAFQDISFKMLIRFLIRF